MSLFRLNNVCTTRSNPRCPISRPLSTLSLSEIDRKWKASKHWYWSNRDRLLQTYQSKVVVVEDEKILASFGDAYEAKLYRDTLRPWCFLTVVGFEDHNQPLLLPEHKRKKENLVHDEHYTPLFEQAIPIGEFKQKILYEGPSLRPFITLPIRTELTQQKVLPVWFMIDTGSSDSFIEISTRDVLFGKSLKAECKEYSIYVDKEPLKVSLMESDFPKINLLGRDFLWRHDIAFSAQTKEISILV